MSKNQLKITKFLLYFFFLLLRIFFAALANLRADYLATLPVGFHIEQLRFEEDLKLFIVQNF